ncbi:MAG: gliding motility-associated C-terminal domain-containing protein [Bacteroidota bacterium]
MKERDEIAELFKDRLEHHAEPVDSAIWTKVQSGLAAKTIGGTVAVGKIGGIIKVIAVTSAIVGSAIGVGVWLQSPDNGNTSSTKEVNWIENTDQTSQPESSLEVSSTENTVQISAVDQIKPTAAVDYQNDKSLSQEKDPVETIFNKEVTDNQNKQIQSNSVATNLEPVVATNYKPIDSKSSANQSNGESLSPALEKSHKNLLTSEIPNIFTPNGDGKNDLFNIPVAENVIHSTKIFSQKGELVVEFTQASNGWDGTKTGGTEVANGTYFYVTFVSDQVGNQKQIKGTINLKR